MIPSSSIDSGAFAIKSTLHRWLIIAALFPYARVRFVSALRKFGSFDLFDSYEAVRTAAAELSSAYEDEVHQKLVEAL